MSTHPNETPIDLAAVAHDDDFLNALTAGLPVAPVDRAEGELGALLFAWRTESLAGRTPMEPTLAQVETAIADQMLADRRRTQMRRLRVVSGAAAIAGVAAAGLLVFSESSQPGDPLWGVKKVVFAEQARQTEATVNTQHNLEDAEAALAAGDVDRSHDLIAAAQRELAPVSDPETRERMTKWIKRLQDGDDPTTVTVSPTTPSTLPTDITGDDPVDETTVTITPTTPSDSETPTSPSTPTPTRSTTPTPTSTSVEVDPSSISVEPTSPRR